MNAVLSGDRAFADSYYPLNKANYKLLQLLLAQAGLSENRYSVLEPDNCPGQYMVLEKRKAMWTKFYIDALLANADPDTLPDIQECSLIDSSGITLLEVDSSSSSSGE